MGIPNWGEGGGGSSHFPAIFADVPYTKSTKFPAFFCFIFILFSVFLILLTVTVCVTIVCTYFLLNAEDYR